MARVALLVSSGGVKSPRSASIAGASGIHHGKQPVPVLRQPVPRALRQQAPRGRLRPDLHWGGTFFRRSSVKAGPQPPSALALSRKTSESKIATDAADIAFRRIKLTSRDF